MNHVIDLVKNKYSLDDPICKLQLVELETLKIYIKKKLGESFIRPSKSFPITQILFVHKN